MNPIDTREVNLYNVTRIVTIRIFGSGTAVYPYYVQIWVDGVYCNLYTSVDLFPQLTSNYAFGASMPAATRLEMIWTGVKSILSQTIYRNNWVIRNAKVCLSPYSTMYDTVRLGTTSTRPDLMHWLHPSNANFMPYIVDIHGTGFKRYSLTPGGHIRMESAYRNYQTTMNVTAGGEPKQWSEWMSMGYEYTRADTSIFDYRSHNPSINMARKFLEQLSKENREGLQYEYAGIYSYSDYDFANAAVISVRDS